MIFVHEKPGTWRVERDMRDVARIVERDIISDVAGSQLELRIALKDTGG